MTDCFALLKEKRRPWIDPDALKDKFHKLGAEHHPDVAKKDGSDFTQLNTAFRTLHDPKTRLRHLIDLEFPGALDGGMKIPPDIERLFETMAREKHSVGGFLAKKANAGSPLELALLSPEKIELDTVLGKLLALLVQKHEGIFMQLRFVDAVWEDDRAASQATLVEIYQEISYVGKWIDQVREDLMKINE